MNSQKCSAVVVGAGPAGLAVIGNLLEKQLGGKIAWVDPYFQAGRVNQKYREVPSNTKVGLFQAYATAVQPFRTVINNTRIPSPFSTMAKLDQEKTCHLHHAADMVRALTEGITKMEQVYACRGHVTAANLVEKTSSWTVRIQRADSLDEVEVITPRLILCTGSSPTEVPIPVCGQHIERLDLDVVLKPSDLVSYLPRNEPQTVGVVGASHSAILALLNLVDLARSTHPQLRIKWFTRHPLRYAEYMDGWILRDNTGLKGSAADFARQQLEEDKLPQSEAGRFITKVDCGGGQEAAQYERHLPSCTHLVQAVGFTRHPIPELSMSSYPLDPEFDSGSGGFHDATGRVVPGLHGAGIAFPERVVDPYGNVEYAVGFWKFMKFIKKVSPQWTA
ncbi:pyridine nucleotide-disulfide oxidoreductase-domain-containing protein [Aspergillus bertholletiae]|uniref:Pyridine nucleotide-disulfide oxidoreductase-domain-containing protein n=1 Tax=Aspergillus bertholletiae TaxID=1226010 RepID=A0A5N7AR77_9EURO|nr:pyridine nucleotide-disulfide oxidoreductase-domain-containing protein [Aspergillus bertholletiae]